jgi:hypothetical protein
MGRYAFFNTGFEYKFAFGIQESSDILKFGGTPTFAYEGSHKHDWTIVDRKRIENTLHDLEDTLGLSRMNFESYEKTYEGTYALLNHLRGIEANDPLFYTYILGCLLYHQLLYKLTLSCTYES